MGSSHHESDHAAQQRLVDEIMGRARLRWPHGQVAPEDEGETALAVAADPAKGVVLIQFSKPMLWLGLRRKETEGLITLLQEKLNQLPL